MVGPIESWPFLPPIGRPIAGAEVYILDEFCQPVSAGVAGEICIGGPVLARGYLNRPDMTAERFISNPFGRTPEERLYRTGDLARHQGDGIIEFLGRLDHQVKVRGFRVECGEIEAVLNRHPEVRQSVVSTWSDDSGTVRLIAYLVPQSGAKPAPAELARYLKISLPTYMIPAAFVFLNALPLLPNGKIHYRALPPPGSSKWECDLPRVAPHSDLEKTIAGIWQEVLGVNRVGSADNFFDLGGDSLRLVQVYSRLKTKVQGEYSIVHMFQYPTVAEFGRFLEDKAHDSDALSGAADRARKQRASFRQGRRRPGGSQ
jgi:acyl carrier protein